MTHPVVPITILAPAKLNLGLEIIAKRPDGYHDIRSVMCAIGLADRIIIAPTGDPDTVSIEGVPEVALHENLVFRAIEAFSAAAGIRSGYRVEVEKHIPSPGGLGGASTDAAAMLRALDRLHEGPLDHAKLIALASALGSDVPFFMGASPAMASGTGTDLAPLPSLAAWAVVVVPRLRLPAKTATLYRALEASDFSDGNRARRVAASITRGALPAPADLANAFERPLYALAPELQTLRDAMIAAGSPYAALSGAGPAHYALFSDRDAADGVAARLRETLPDSTLVAATPLGGPHDART